MPSESDPIETFSDAPDAESCSESNGAALPKIELRPKPAMFSGDSTELIVQLKLFSAPLMIDGIDEKTWTKLAEYCLQLWSWNQSINLTRHTTPELFVKRDLLDSWHLAKLLNANEEVLDIGTGGGVPGVVVAILRPDVEMSLCDSVAKKATVITRIVDHLGLSISVHAVSVQKVLRDLRFDSLTSRGVGPLSRLCTWLKDDWHNFQRLLAIKGPKWVDERGEARHQGLLKDLELRRVAAYPMPDTFSESTILQIQRPRPT